MIFDDALAHVLTAPATLPQRVQDARITLRYAVAETAADEAAGLLDLLTIILPLYRAGFLSADGAPTLDVACDMTMETGQSACFALTGFGHTPVMLHGLLRLVWLSYQTPPGAFDQLVQMLGDVEEAKEIFQDRNFADLITTVTLSAKGQGDVPFANMTVPRTPEYATLAAHIARSPRDLDIEIKGRFSLPQDVENAFLTAHNAGLFGDPPPLTQAEPEIWTTPAGDGVVLHVRDYMGDASYLVELINLCLAGDLSTVAKVIAA